MRPYNIRIAIVMLTFALAMSIPSVPPGGARSAPSHVAEMHGVADDADVATQDMLTFESRFGGSTYAIDHDNGTVFVGIGVELALISSSNPPRKQGSIEMPDIVRDVHVAGTTAFVAAGSGGLRIVDVFRRGRPMEIGAFPTRGPAIGVFAERAEGGPDRPFVWVATGDQGLVVLDVTDPTAPAEVAAFDWAAQDLVVQRFTADATYAYVACGDEGVRIVDAANPRAPFEVSHVPGAAPAFKTEWARSRLFVAQRANGMDIYDVRDPEVMQYEGHVFETVWDLASESGYLFTAAGDEGVFAYKIGTGSPRLVDRDPDVEGPAVAIDSDNRMVYAAAAAGGMRIIDANEGQNEVTFHWRGTYDEPGDAVAVDGSPGGPVFLGDADGHVWRVDGDRPRTPDWIGDPSSRSNPVHDVAALTVHRAMLYVAAGSQGLLVGANANLRNLATAESAGSKDARGLFLDRGRDLYIADGIHGLAIVDVLDPAGPRLVGRLDTDGIAYDVFVDGETAYLADGPGGVTVVDVSAPTAPRARQRFQTTEPAVAIADDDGRRLVTAHGTGGLTVWSMGSSGDLTQERSLRMASPVHSVVVRNGFALLAADAAGLCVVDLESEGALRLLGCYDTPGAARSVFVRDTRLFVADWDGGATVLHFDEPSRVEQPTATAVPSATPVVVPTSTTAPSTTPEPTTARPTETSVPLTPRPVYLPLVLRDRYCLPRQLFTDVVLLIDASRSMLDPEFPGGRKKVDVAIESARTFIEGFFGHHTPNYDGEPQPEREDMIGLIMFNKAAYTRQVLTRDQARLLEELEFVRFTDEGSRIDIGINAAVEALFGPFGNTGRLKALVILSDGRANPQYSEEVREAATAARERGVRIFTIGYGRNHDPAMLQELSSEEQGTGQFYFDSPDGAALKKAYERLRIVVPCPAHLYWPFPSPPKALGSQL